MKILSCILYGIPIVIWIVAIIWELIWPNNDLNGSL
jgi:hypothetical protein